MAESKKLVSKNHRLHTARQLIESLNEPANTAYYVFLGNHLEYANTSNIPQPVDSVSETVIDVYRNMIYGKRLSENDVKLMIPRNNYVSNKVYDMYDDTVGESNVALFDSNYYAVVNADAFYHVFKCLDNNLGVNSTVQPEFSEIDVQDEVYQTSDGYVWKYMYTVDNVTVAKFATTDYFPVVANSAISAAAKEGIINVIKVETIGRGYDNYCNGTFRADDLRLNGNALIYSINASLTANTVNDYYNGCYLYIANGTGIGQYSKINSYVVNSTVKAIILETSLETPPQSDSFYEITPGVNIIGDGTQAVNAVARAIVNTAGNTIQRVEMLNLGTGYKYAIANVIANPVVGVAANAALRPIYSPHGGHGYDAAAELGSTRVGFSLKFSNTDIGVPLTNEYRTLGIIKDPLFANVTINFSTATGTFTPDENVYKIESGVQINTNATINTTSAIITAAADFVNQLDVGEYIYFTDSSTYQLAVVNSIVNSSYITLKSNGNFNTTSGKIYKTGIGASTTSINISPTVLAGTLSVNTTSPNAVGTSTSFTTTLLPGSKIFVYGNSSGAGEVKTVVTVANNTRIVLNSNLSFANASAKAQVLNYTITSKVDSGLQAAAGYVTSVASGSLIASNVAGIFKTGDMIIGETSGATGIITTVQRGGVAKDFETFVQMYKYMGTPLNGVFSQDEIVFQSETNDYAEAYANGRLHSVTGAGASTNYFITDQVGLFNTGVNLFGANSDASATISDKYSPELVFGTGEVLYLEKIDAITRTNTGSETIKFIFEF